MLWLKKQNKTKNSKHEKSVVKVTKICFKWKTKETEITLKKNIDDKKSIFFLNN